MLLAVRCAMLLSSSFVTRSATFELDTCSRIMLCVLHAGCALDIPPGYMFAMRAPVLASVVVTRYLGYTSAIRALHTMAENTLLYLGHNRHALVFFRGTSARMGLPGWKLVLENAANVIYGLEYNLSAGVDIVRLDPAAQKLPIGPSAAQDLGGAGLALGRTATLLVAVKALQLSCLHSDVFSKFYNIVCNMTGVSESSQRKGRLGEGRQAAEAVGRSSKGFTVRSSALGRQTRQQFKVDPTADQSVFGGIDLTKDSDDEGPPARVVPARGGRVGGRRGARGGRGTPQGGRGKGPRAFEGGRDLGVGVAGINEGAAGGSGVAERVSGMLRG